MEITFTQIGIVRNCIKERHAMPPGGVASEIHIDKKYAKALFRITNETHLWVLSYLHLAKTDVLRAKPRKSKTINRQTRGVFSIHSPDRPNPIALSKVRLVSCKGLVLFVDGLDIINGTPVLDIKGE